MGHRNKTLSNETMAERLAQLLETQGWTYRSLANRIGKSHTTIGNWCNGGAIRDADLQRLAAVLQVSASWLRYGHASASTQLQRELLQRVITHVESHLDNRGLDLPAHKRAHVIATAYDAAVRSGGQTINDETLAMLVAMATA